MLQHNKDIRAKEVFASTRGTPEIAKFDYPRTKMFFPETLYARFVHIDFDHYNPDPFGIDDNLIQFSEYLGDFWNKVNGELMRKYPKK